MPNPVTDDSFDTDVLHADGPVLVDFWAEWCSPCRMLTPTISNLSKTFPNNVYKVNVDMQKEIAVRFGVRGIPYLVLFNNGQPVDTKSGAMPKAGFDQWLNTHMA